MRVLKAGPTLDRNGLGNCGTQVIKQREVPASENVKPSEGNR